MPVWDAFEENNAVYQPRYLSDSGRVFFNSSDGLVPQDSNGQGDVYQWEPGGAGPEGARCGPGVAGGSEVFKPARGFEAGGQAGEETAGCVALVSSGTSAQESAFLDASAGDGPGESGVPGKEAGSDIFFLTTSHLVPSDVEGGLSVYDAHECTTTSPCLPAQPTSPPQCTTAEGCRAAPEPQPSIYGTPPSQTFNGLGNPAPEAPAPAVVKPKPKPLTRAQKLAKALASCHRDKKKAKRNNCEKTAKKLYGPVKKAKKK